MDEIFWRDLLILKTGIHNLSVTQIDYYKLSHSECKSHNISFSFENKEIVLVQYSYKLPTEYLGSLNINRRYIFALKDIRLAKLKNIGM